MSHVLIVDDDPDIIQPLKRFLGDHSLRVSTANGGREMRKILENGAIDIILLDIMMPGEDGLTLCRYVQEKYKIPVILLTALSDDADKVVGLEMGADDYISKPFNARLLLARLKAVLRRCDRELATPEEDEQVVAISFGDWTLDIFQREIVDQDNVATALSAAEYKLLQVFLQRPQRILSRDQLLDLTHGREAKAYDRSIDNLTSRLRRKIETDSNAPKIIKTVRGGGYTLAVPVSKILSNA
jgi:two-component system OmpR family response regulator